MALLQRKTEEERAEQTALKEQRQREQQERRHAAAIENQRQAFFRTPAGQARVAFDRGDRVFQYAIDVMHQQAIIVAMAGSRTSKSTTDPVDVLNSVCHEGWELVSGSFVFVEQGQQSRDKFMSSGQNVAIKGTTVGYYLFKRCESNQRTPLPEPWLGEENPMVDVWTCVSCGAEIEEAAIACPSCGDTFADEEPEITAATGADGSAP